MPGCCVSCMWIGGKREGGEVDSISRVVRRGDSICSAAKMNFSLSLLC